MNPNADDIAGLGNVKATPRQNPGFSPDARLSPEDYFVWTRCDGRTSLREIIAMVGLGADRTTGILRRLREIGAVLMEGETPETVAARGSGRASTAPPSQAESSAEVSLNDEVPDLGALAPDEEQAMGESVELEDREKRRIIAARRALARTHFDVLGVDGSVGRRELKRAYFRLSKTFHPDRYYHRRLGSFGPWLTQIFEAIARAFAVLSDDREKTAYLTSLRGDKTGPVKPRAQTREEHAGELFHTACERELTGNLPEAMKLFAAAIRGDPQPRYLRRAAACGIKAGELSSAEHYARMAFELRPRDASYARVLAEVYRAQDRLADAERVLLTAIELNLENDSLLRELKADLAAVRSAQNRDH